MDLDAEIGKLFIRLFRREEHRQSLIAEKLAEEEEQRRIEAAEAAWMAPFLKSSRLQTPEEARAYAEAITQNHVARQEFLERQRLRAEEEMRDWDHK